jgi:hypothetical protein
LRATLAFLEKLTQKPGDVSAADVQVLHEAGVDSAAIREAVYVALVLEVGVRLADALGFTVPSPESLARAARMKLKKRGSTPSEPPQKRR